jgi:hypothetical protein
LDPSLSLRFVKVAGEDQISVVRYVILSEKGLDIVERGRREVCHRSDHRMMVRVALGVHDADRRLLRLAIGYVIDAKAAFVLYNITLVIELRLVHRVEQVAHAIRFEVEGPLQKV